MAQHLHGATAQLLWSLHSYSIQPSVPQPSSGISAHQTVADKHHFVDAHLLSPRGKGLQKEGFGIRTVSGPERRPA
jgi:hypothetical protein